MTPEEYVRERLEDWGAAADKQMAKESGLPLAGIRKAIDKYNKSFHVYEVGLVKDPDNGSYMKLWAWTSRKR